MKLMIVTPYYYPNIGGVQNYAKNIAEGLRRKYDWDVIVVTSNYNKHTYKEEKINGLKVYRLPFWFKFSNTPINPFWYFFIKNIIKKEKPDIVNAHSPVPFMSDIVSINCKDIPFVLTYHSGSMIKGNAKTDILIRLYENIFLYHTIKRAKKIVCVSDFVRLVFLKDHTGKSVTITPSVDTKKFFAKNFSIKNKNKVIFVGRIDKASEWKGTTYLLDAINLVKEKIPKVKLQLAGSGDALEGYQQYVKKNKLGKFVRFLGALKGRKLVNAYRNTNVLVLPSITEAESFGIVLIEAMACKIPVIGTRIGGIPSVIDHGKTGLLVKPENADELAEAIYMILSNPQYAQQLGEKGFEKVKNKFTLEKNIFQTHLLLNKVLGI